MVGVGRGALAGVLIKNAEALERMERIDTLVVDKTGTLTEGRPKVVAVVAAQGVDETQVLRPAGSVRGGSEPPRGRAVVEAAAERGIALAAATDFDAPTGKGVSGTVDGRKVALGNAKLLGGMNIAATALDADAERLRQDGATVVHLAVD